jgi:hypothetical protein
VENVEKYLALRGGSGTIAAMQTPTEHDTSCDGKLTFTVPDGEFNQKVEVSSDVDGINVDESFTIPWAWILRQLPQLSALLIVVQELTAMQPPTPPAEPEAKRPRKNRSDPELDALLIIIKTLKDIPPDGRERIIAGAKLWLAARKAIE